ncbi:MAG TPA: glutamate racemase [Steroidobacteraceae bacterium]|nr:glutamate racemase [Steroidobacteraceae bacterium]
MTGEAHRPIGVFDSGIGGLTVLRALIDELPHERFVYLGDTARLPYGTKAAETVARYSVQAADALMEHGVKCIVVACNTAASVGLESIRERLRPLPVIGVIDPGAEAACATSRSGHIAVIATERTVSGGAYQQAILARRPQARVSMLATQLLVALAEEGLSDGPIAESVARHYLERLFGTAGADGASPDTLVLGCTHFPALLEPIRRALAPGVRIVDSAATTAQALRRELAARELIAPHRGATAVRFVATDGVERFARVGGRFLGRPIVPEEVELIDL